MAEHEYVELSRILIGFPLPYVAAKELHIIGIYAGVCTDFAMHILNQYTEVEITAKSFSYMADVKLGSLTFQNPSKHLGEVVEAVFERYGFVVSQQENIPVPIMLSQQEETDWAFVRRIQTSLAIPCLWTVNPRRSGFALTLFHFNMAYRI